MKTTIKKLLCVAVAAALGTTSGASWAGAVVGATEFTQIANNIQLLISYVEQAQQTVHQFNQYQAMLRNLQRSTPSSVLNQAAANLWQDQNMLQTFKTLQSIVIDGQKIDYTLQNQDQQFKRLHPGYGAAGTATDFKNAYRNWSDNTLGAVKNSLALAGAHAQNFSQEQDMVNELQSRAQTADGQMQALKAGSDIGVAMVGQMQQLKQLQIAQMTAQGQFVAGQQDRVDMESGQWRDYMNGMKRTRVRTIKEIESGVPPQQQ